MNRLIELAEVQPIDRALYIMLFKLPERVHVRVHQGEQDHTDELQAIAKHRLNTTRQS